ncbi:MAG TPA: acyltransferase family protein, partial [Acidimicrobiia bacterium]
GRALGCKPLRWIGLRSYSLYLWHYPIFCVTRPGLDIHRLGIWFLSIQYAGWPVFVFRLALSFGAAELSYRFVETPIRKGAIGRYRVVVREAVGERRRRLVRRGAVIGSSLTIVALMLGTGLATAQPQATSIPGVGASEPDNGGKLDPSALRALQDSPTTAPRTKVTRPGAPTTTTRPRQPVATAHVLGIGDSVMQGAKASLVAAIPGMAVDAIRSRQFSQAIQVVQQYESLSALPTVIVIHLGTNGRITSDLFDQMMRTIGPRHTVYFLTARVPRLWEAEVNVTLHDGVKRWRNAHILEWRDYAGCHDDWFVADGFHLRTAGQHAYAAFVHLGLIGKAPTTCTK